LLQHCGKDKYVKESIERSQARGECRTWLLRATIVIHYE
jgi:hypothetical protein